MKHSRACIWDYLSVIYRDPAEPIDPRAWMLRDRSIYSPRHLLADLRGGRWRELPLIGRVCLACEAGMIVAGAGAVIAVVALAASFGKPGVPAPAWPLRLAGGVVLVMFVWPVVWAAWVALGGTDRATAVLRRARTCGRRDLRAGDLVVRRTFWRLEIHTWAQNRRFSASRHWVDPLFAAAGAALAALGLAAVMAYVVTGDARPVLASMLPLPGMALWGRWRRRRLEARLLAALEGAGCPDCGYPLLGVLGRPAGDDLARLPGPRRCAECGSPWPLLPPPLPRGATSDWAGRHGRRLPSL